MFPYLRLAKLFETFITEALSTTIHNILLPEQHGFIRGRSVETNLLVYSQFIIESLENGFQVDSAYTDFSKAFDTVNHERLISKLQNLGIGDPLLSWLSSYLTDRVQMVKIKSCLSKTISAVSGAPQGSHLGPLRFLIFINDIKDFLGDTRFLLFADDLKLYRIIQSEDDCSLLQSDLDSLCDWSVSNGMKLNISKCNIIRFQRKQCPIIYEYKIDNTIINSVSVIKDLGVLLDEQMSFNSHIDYITSKSLRILGFIKRITVGFGNTYAIRLLYFSLVRSILEFSATVWCPYYLNQINSLERVQHKFIKYLAFKSGLCSTQI